MCAHGDKLTLLISKKLTLQISNKLTLQTSKIPRAK